MRVEGGVRDPARRVRVIVVVRQGITDSEPKGGFSEPDVTLRPTANA